VGFAPAKERALKEVNYVFGALEEPDVEVLMRIGSQQQLYASDELITEKTITTRSTWCSKGN